MLQGLLRRESDGMTAGGAYSPISEPLPAETGSDTGGPYVPQHHVGLLHADAFRRNSHFDLKGVSQPTSLPGRPVFMRPKKSRVVRWLVLHANGDRQMLTLDKRNLIQTFKLDIPIRDMRLLDSSFSNYETIGQISVRDNTIVFSMEHFKAMIMADKVFIPLEEDKNDVKERFIVYLEQSVQERAAELQQQAKQADDDSVDLYCDAGLPSRHSAGAGGTGGTGGGAGGGGGGGMAPSAFASLSRATYHDHDSSDVLPFELHVLEAALGEICNHLAREVDSLQAAAQPALEELTRNADQPTLERVRRIKTGHQRLIGRVKLVREVLERLMEDDGDMLRMCLTRQSLRRAATLQHSLSGGQQGGGGRPVAGHLSSPASRERLGVPFGAPTGVPIATTTGGGGMTPGAAISGDSSFAFGPGTSPSFPQSGSMPYPGGFLAMNLRRHGHGNHNNAPMEAIDAEEAHDLLDVENLLESYFMLVDSTHQSLVSIGEYIDDTEDLINIQLDYSRNKLIRFEIVLTTGTFAIAIFSAVAGMLGENLQLPDVITSNFWGFALINFGVLMICGLCYSVIVRLLITRRLI